MNLRRAAWLAAALWLAGGLAGADERILSYDVLLEVQPDGSLEVEETIHVRAEGDRIRRGIYRDFPTRYRDRHGNRYRVGFEVRGVTRDGGLEPWHTERRSNGERVYIGSADHYLEPGEYRYRLRYVTQHQLGFFENHDELYWNVTGNDWDFQIDHAAATVRLPEPVPEPAWRLDAYTGPQGSRESHATARVLDARSVGFETTRPLSPREGLTIAVGWPKGLVPEPTSTQRAARFLGDNLGTLALLLGLLLPLAWYAWAWNRHGRDPRPGIIIPRFEPPAGLSPAACRYVERMGLDNAAFTAALISLAVKGHVVIDERGKDFSVTRAEGAGKATASRGEVALMNALFSGGQRQVKMDDEEHRRFLSARAALTAQLKREYAGQLFRRNTWFALPPVAVSLLAGLAGVVLPGSHAWVLVYAGLSLLMHGIAVFLLRAPTPAGRKVLDEIEGFRRYLDTAEQDRLERMRAPALTPEVFEMFLPYAHALGVANSWCKRFEHELPEAAREMQRHSGWYRGGRGGSLSDRVGNSFGRSLGGAIASASSPPGSSSGGGGGGSSGGGGGGGGGGGW
ncbi:MAG: DUF2207 domain-containing protein [Xanthomonadales bacterium]|nr:DUF2207 domain-containing protein [Xanthomonadales bacterium]